MQENSDAGVIRYVKLGKNGAWFNSALANQRLEFDYADIPVGLAASGDWSGVRAKYIAAGRSEGVATRFANELRAFVTAGPEDIWITFERGRLYWGRAHGPLIDLAGQGGAAKGRALVDGWRCEDARGRPLLRETIAPSLTRVASAQGALVTIAPPLHDPAYVRALLAGEESQLVAEAAAARSALIAALARLIARLEPTPFELLIELILERGGWRRETEVGGALVDIDFIARQGATGERAFVQVKSRADARVARKSLERYRGSPGYDRFFFACHTPIGGWALECANSEHVWLSDALAERALEAGLLDWVMARAR